MNFYADTSFLVSVYLTDTHTPRALELLPTIDGALPLADLHLLELQNALSLAVFQRCISPAQAQLAWQDMTADLQAGRLAVCAVNWQAAFRLACDLAKTETPAVGSRSLDVLHLAAALLLGVEELLTFDNRQRSLAASVGLAARTF